MELVIPAAAVDTGKANIPPPIDVPTMSKIPPKSLELATETSTNSLKLIQYDTLVVSVCQFYFEPTHEDIFKWMKIINIFSCVGPRSVRGEEECNDVSNRHTNLQVHIDSFDATILPPAVAAVFPISPQEARLESK